MFRLSIITPQGEFLSTQADYICVNTPNGRAGFMKGALPRITVVSEGVTEVTDTDGKACYECGDGFLRVEKLGISLIVSYCKVAGEKEQEQAQTSSRTVEYAKAKIASTVRRLNDTPDDNI